MIARWAKSAKSACFAFLAALLQSNGLYSNITAGGSFNMELYPREFAKHYAETYAPSNAAFLESL